MDPGWHTYWVNPGESGLSTTVRWNLPPGFSVGALLWPLPEKHIESGDVLTYGYSGETLLLASVTPPDDLQSGTPVVLKADVEWLECESTCIPGSSTVELTLPVLASAPRPANEALFQKYRALVPPDWSEKAGFVFTVSEAEGEVRLRLTPVGEGRFVSGGADGPDFYPEPSESFTVGRARVNAQPTDVRIVLPVRPSGKDGSEAALTGVVVYRMEGGDRLSARVRLPLSQASPRVAEQGAEAPPPGGLLDRSFTVAADQVTPGALALYLVFSIIGGLLLNVMPCVLPVIALKVFGIVRMAGDHPAQVRRLGWFFSLGILASFLSLAILVAALKLGGQQVGWGFQFQEPLFVLSMSAIVFAFGLSLFGVFEIRLPGAAVTGASDMIVRRSGKGKGYAASFWEGVFATVLATPCTAPFLGSALGFAFSQPPWVILLIFTFVAVGMALPYLLLTARPAWMKYLPRPGAWMESAKQFMGFLMMATLLWLLYVLGKQLGMEAVIWAGGFLLAVAVACWMIGRFATLTASRRATLLTWAGALLVVTAGYLLFVRPVLEARDVLTGASADVPGGASAPGEIAWEAFSLPRLESYLREGKPVFLDFTAEWCLTCKVNEKTVLADRVVVERFRSSGIIPVRADWTTRNPEITALLGKFGRSGVPLYVLFPAGAPDAPIVLPEVITNGIVLEAIDRAVRR
jgi:thiol:disulfide interchange protein DsbD